MDFFVWLAAAQNKGYTPLETFCSIDWSEKHRRRNTFNRVVTTI